MKNKPALLLLALPLSTSLPVRAADGAPAPAPASQVTPATAVTPASILTAQIQEILQTPDLDDAAKQRQVGSALRMAIATAMTNLKDPEEAARRVAELTDAAATAAPQFGDVIFRTVTAAVHEIPLLAKQTGLVESLRDVITAAIDIASGNEAAGAQRGDGNDQGGRRGNQNDQGQNNNNQGRRDDVIVSPSR